MFFKTDNSSVEEKIKKLYICLNIIFLGILFGKFLLNSAKVNAANINCKKLSEYVCNGVGQDCWKHYWYEYDNAGNTIQYYSPFKNKIEETGYNYSLEKFFNGPKHWWIRRFDKNGREIDSYECYDANFQNCSKYTKNIKYYEKGKIFEEYSADGSTLRYRYTYDEKGRLLTEYKIFGNLYTKYIYDEKGNKIKTLTLCDKTYNNCKRGDETKFNEKNEIITERKSCNWETNKCSSNFKHEYTYDNIGNKTESVFSCDNNFANCECLHKDLYDSKGRKIFGSLACGKNDFGGTYKQEFDNNGKVIAKYDCASDGAKCTLQARYKYDMYGNLIEENVKKNNTFIILKTEYICQ